MDKPFYINILEAERPKWDLLIKTVENKPGLEEYCEYLKDLREIIYGNPTSEEPIGILNDPVGYRSFCPKTKYHRMYERKTKKLLKGRKNE